MLPLTIKDAYNVCDEVSFLQYYVSQIFLILATCETIILIPNESSTAGNQYLSTTFTNF